MNIKITLKDPDGPYDCIRAAVKKSVNALVEQGHLSADEADDLVESRAEAETKKLGRWFSHGEYLAVEFDTDAGTATVLQSKP